MAEPEPEPEPEAEAEAEVEPAPVHSPVSPGATTVAQSPASPASPTVWGPPRPLLRIEVYDAAGQRIEQ